MGTTERIELEWKSRCTARSLDSAPPAVLASRGIYVWIYRNAAASRVACVGKSVGFPFKKRLAEHFRVFFGGGYPAYRINEEEDYLDFLATKVLDRKSGEVLAHENIRWYRDLKSSDYFRATFFEEMEKKHRILDHHLAHLEFAFAPLKGLPSERVARVEAALGRSIHEAYVRKLRQRYPHPVGRSFSWPDGRSDDTLVGRHSQEAAGSTIEINHSVRDQSVELQSLLKIMSPGCL